MGSVIRVLPGLVCGGAMASCMWFMVRGRRHGGAAEDGAKSSQHPDVKELRDEIARLRAQVQSRQDEHA